MVRGARQAARRACRTLVDAPLPATAPGGITTSSWDSPSCHTPFIHFETTIHTQA